MNTSCFFTGHRRFKASTELFARLNDTLISLIEEGVTDFYAGGALGWDMFCEHEILKLKKTFPHIKLHLVLPCEPSDQCKKWKESEKEVYNKIYSMADSVELVSKRYYDGCMRKRNERLTELGGVCVCCWDGRRSGGTFQTVNMAGNKGIRVVNVYN